MPAQIRAGELLQLPLAALAHHLAETRGPRALSRDPETEPREALLKFDQVIERRLERRHAALLENLRLPERRIAVRALAHQDGVERRQLLELLVEQFQVGEEALIRTDSWLGK